MPIKKQSTDVAQIIKQPSRMWLRGVIDFDESGSYHFNP